MAIQRADLGRVLPSASELTSILEDGVGTWIGDHCDDRPTNGSMNLVKSDGIYDAINSQADDRITAALAAALGEGGSISTAIQNFMGPMQSQLDAQGVNISGFTQALEEAIASAVGTAVGELGIDEIRAAVTAIQNLDLIATLLDNDDDGWIDLGDIVLIEVTENTHRVLDLSVDGALNKTYYCVTNNGGADENLKIVFPDAANNGDTALIEFRSRGNYAAILDGLCTASQHTNAATQTTMLSGVLTNGGELDNTAMYSRIRASFAYGKWLAEVVQFSDSSQTSAAKWTVTYNTSNFAGVTWGYSETVVQGSYRLAGRKADYCGMRHTGWNTAANGSGTAYALGADIMLTDDITVYPVYAEHVSNQNVPNGTGGGCGYSSLGSPVSKSPAVIDASDIPNWKELYLYVDIDIWCNDTMPGNTATLSVTGRADKTITFTDSRWSGNGNAYKSYAGFSGLKLTRSSSTANFVPPSIRVTSDEVTFIPYVSKITFKREEA